MPAQCLALEKGWMPRVVRPSLQMRQQLQMVRVLRACVSSHSSTPFWTHLHEKCLHFTGLFEIACAQYVDFCCREFLGELELW